MDYFRLVLQFVGAMVVGIAALVFLFELLTPVAKAISLLRFLSAAGNKIDLSMFFDAVRLMWNRPGFSCGFSAEGCSYWHGVGQWHAVPKDDPPEPEVE
ncbi:hypothetical protein ACDA63_07420 [Uliginosibacterium sp. sgz301328]|uniref:hypothetical protein n=1 Tax=Uliginosibacterium sp. sgz301328 TaxID=3243764 RepID=UPI00359D217B